MKTLRFACLSAVVAITALSPVAHAEEAYPVGSPADVAGSGDWLSPDTGFDRPYVEDRLTALRHTYTGALLRFRLASALSAQETAIGIRADQETAWRAYTNALIALIPKRDTVLSLIGAPNEKTEGPEAFERAESLADALKDLATEAETLKAAITALRAVLTPEQIEAARVPRFARG